MKILKVICVFLFILTFILPTSGIAEQNEKEESRELKDVVVTGTREKKTRFETPATIGTIKEEEIAETKPAHPSEVMRRLPGVHVNATNGEGHMTAIRQPITTGAVYLYLEDGVPTRSTGFFNHNALYEVNVQQSAGVEVTKGPGTALYGSDAIGGVINVLTRPAPFSPEIEATLEGGSYGYIHGLLSAGNTWGLSGLLGEVNISHSNGWRDGTEFDRQTTKVRWDGIIDDKSRLKTIISFSNINQQTAGTSRLSKNDYLNDPTLNYTPISFRDVKAFRASTAYERESESSLFSIIPYARYNKMDLLPNWTLTFDPQNYSTENKSVGMLTKYRHDFKSFNSRAIIGVDLDYSPGSRFEEEIDPTKVGSIFTSFTTVGTSYDYDAAFYGVSPYIHGEISPLERLHLNTGLRFDYMGYDYDNNLSVVTTGTHRRPADTTVTFTRVSPKFGATYDFTKNSNIFFSYNHAFRAPGQGQLFRQGQAENTVDLKPTKAKSYEVGLRGKALQKLDYEISAYHMTKEDDILSFRNTTDGTRETLNAGGTLHRGLEFGIGAAITKELHLGVSYSYAKHTFEDWSPRTGVDYSGNEMTSAPREIGDIRFAYKPSFFNGGRIELEYERLGSYWMDDENTTKYDGHHLLHLRGNYLFDNSGWEIFARIINMTDARFAQAASFSQFRGEEFAPGMPLSVYGGVTYKWGDKK